MTNAWPMNTMNAVHSTKYSLTDDRCQREAGIEECGGTMSQKGALRRPAQYHMLNVGIVLA